MENMKNGQQSAVGSQVRLGVKINSFKYPDGTAALSNINIEINGGEFIGILGANGSGKTTLLKIMNGLMKDFEGGVHLDGVNIRKLSPKEIYKKVGLVFQNPDDQLFATTLFEDVAFGPINMGIGTKEVEILALTALQEVELQGLEKKTIRNLSFGQRKRACIAGLLSMGHEILLLDEPTAGLDPMGEYKMMRLLGKLNKDNGVTIVMATHSVDLVPLFLDRLYILSKGRIVRGGIPEEVFTAPEEMANVKLRLPYIAGLLHDLKRFDGVPIEGLPLTVGEARKRLLELIPEALIAGKRLWSDK